MSNEQQLTSEQVVTRYKHEFQRSSGSREMVEDADGEWVKWDDYESVLQIAAHAGQRCLQHINTIKALEERMRQMERDHREDMRAAVAEERRSITTGEPYGTY